VVLQNYGSASAAEIVSAAIKENRRGDLVGVRTFGKAALQNVFPLENDSAVLLSTAKFYSQSGKVIQNNGVLPDHEVRDGIDAFQGDVEAEDDEDANHENPPGPKPSSQEDLQLKKAIELLSAPASERQKAA